MAPKSLFWWLCILVCISLTACGPKTQASPTTDQKVIASAVAATLEAASTATQRAMPTLPATEVPAPTFTLPPAEPTLPPATPTTPPSPTTAPPLVPDTLVAYTKNSDVYLWTRNDGPSRLTDMHDVVGVRLSEDGTLIAFKRQDPNDITLQELWVVNSSGVPNPSGHPPRLNR